MLLLADVGLTLKHILSLLQVPTTVMATVDSSVGGKTGVNHPLGKNMIGAFYQPQCVLIDTDTLRTLPDRELASGISEIVKYGLIRDAPLFEWLEQNMDKLLQRDHEVILQLILPRTDMLAILCGWYIFRLTGSMSQLWLNDACVWLSNVNSLQSVQLPAVILTPRSHFGSLQSV